jgi:hypothetical protein
MTGHIQLLRFVLGHVDRIYGEEKAPQAAVVLWAFLHGMTALQAAGVFDERQPFESFEFGLRMWIKAASIEVSHLMNFCGDDDAFLRFL